MRTVLVLGATGGIGSETAHALSRRGWRIRALVRNGRPADSNTSWEWVTGDALSRDSIMAAAQGAQAIVHAVNPPGYRNWSSLVLPMVENSIAAARESGARIVLPGTIYNYGPDAFPILREDSPQRATTHKGKIRIALERRLEAAAKEGIRSLVVRLGDFFGPKAGNNWFSQALVKPNLPVTSITYPGEKGIGHAWCYLPDAGEAFAQIMERASGLRALSFPRSLGRGRDADGHRNPRGCWEPEHSGAANPLVALPLSITRQRDDARALCDPRSMAHADPTGQQQAGALSW